MGFVRALKKVGFKPKMLFETSAPSFGDQYSKGVGVDATEGIFYAVSHTPEAATPGNEEFVAKYKEMFGGSEVPGGRGGRLRDGRRSSRRPSRPSARSSAATRPSSPTGCTRTRSTRSSARSAGTRRAGPQGEFLVGQWQDGKPEIVLPEAVATTDTIVMTVRRLTH